MFHILGGLDIKSQEAALRQLPDIVIATPGRLIDHLRNAPSFHLDNIEVLILDEADRLETCWLKSVCSRPVLRCFLASYQRISNIIHTGQHIAYNVYISHILKISIRYLQYLIR